MTATIRTLNYTYTLQTYLAEVTLREPDILKKLRQETTELGGPAVMQIGADQGQLMSFLVELTGAKQVLEVGTFTGYSALACALALPPDGQLTACDVSEEWTNIAKRYWEQAGVSQKIDLRLAPAANTLNELIHEGRANDFDMMFIDADKTNYKTYYELGLQLVRPGGLILIDNVLWSGDVANPSVQDEDTRAIRDLNAFIQQDNRVSSVTLTVGDGITLIRRRL